jgi:hypothetical protein
VSADTKKNNAQEAATPTPQSTNMLFKAPCCVEGKLLNDKNLSFEKTPRLNTLIALSHI